ncbi:MAG: YbjN domain-containing protein [Maricaulaceae bacterium]
MDLMTSERDLDFDPLDVVEQVVIGEQYVYERTEDRELHMAIPGQWCDHQIWFAWKPDMEMLHVCLSLDVKAPKARRPDICDLVALLNERLWIGHFDVWAEDGAIVYRHSLVLPDGEQPSPAQIAHFVAHAVEAGERFHPAFNYLVWGGKTPHEAAEAALFETAGEA